MSDTPISLQEIATRLKQDPNYEHLPLTTRGLLRVFGAERRGSWVVESIRQRLKTLGIETEPDFENTWIDSPIKLRLVPKAVPKNEEMPHAEQEPPSENKEEEDPTFRIGRLEGVSRSVLSVKPEDTIEKAATIMLLHDFSQMPVMTTEKTIKGMLTWKSISSSLAFGGTNSLQAKDCMLPHFEVRNDTSLFEAMPGIIQNGYVIIRAEDSSIAGILTVGDLSLEFRQLTEPFLLLQQIEKHLRNLLVRIPAAQFKTKCKEILTEGIEGEISGEIADLSLGDYLRLLENQAFWDLLSIKIDRASFINELHEVRKIRNRVMHFDQDGLKEFDKERLRNASIFFQNLSTLLHIKSKGKK